MTQKHGEFAHGKIQYRRGNVHHSVSGQQYGVEEYGTVLTTTMQERAEWKSQAARSRELAGSRLWSPPDPVPPQEWGSVLDPYYANHWEARRVQSAPLQRPTVIPHLSIVPIMAAVDVVIETASS